MRICNRAVSFDGVLANVLHYLFDFRARSSCGTTLIVATSMKEVENHGPEDHRIRIRLTSGREAIFDPSTVIAQALREHGLRESPAAA